MRKLDEADRASSRMRKRRNKLIAHFDSPTILNNDAPLIEWPTTDEIEQTVRLLIEAMNLAEGLLGKAIHDYSLDEFRDGSATLIGMLKEADKKTSIDHSD
jgi:hypothetical protein